MSAYLENINISRGHALASTALILSVLAILFAVSMRATPCASAASGSCSVGETETFAGTLGLGKDADIEWEGATEDDFETTITVTDPTADRTITFPDASGTVALSGGGAATVPEGGTGVTTLGANGVLIGNTASAVNVTAAGNAGEVLTSNGAGSDPTFQSAGATVYIDQWRVPADSFGNKTPITNWEQVDDATFSAVGTAMVHEGSGIWKFPATGVWSVRFKPTWYANGATVVGSTGAIYGTANNGGAWDELSRCYSHTEGVAWNDWMGCNTESLFYVQDVDDYHVKFHAENMDASEQLWGDTDVTVTGVTFQWIGNP